MTDTKPKRPAPIAFRVTPEERARLESDAAGLSLGAYIRWRLFDPDSPPPRRRGKAPVKDHQALSAVLAKLGQTRLASNINQLAKAAHIGSLIVTPDIEAALRNAASDIASMRRMLIAALGLSEDRP